MELHRHQNKIYLASFVLIIVLVSCFVITAKPVKVIAAAPNDPLATTAGIDGQVTSVFSTSTKIYIGGSFSHVGGQARNNLAALNLDGTLDAAWDPNVTGSVNSIYATGSAVYIGGVFNTVNGATTRNNAAAFPIANAVNTGTALAWNPDVNDTIFSVLGNGTKIYLGGQFFSVGGVDRFALAAVDSTTGALDMAWDPKMSAYVQDLAINSYDNKLYVVGAFSVVNFGQATEATRNRAANFNLADGVDVGAVQGWDPDLDNSAYAIAIDDTINGNRIYLGGAFTAVGGTFINHAARVFNEEDGATLDTDWDPGPDANVFDIKINDSGSIFLAGYFETVFGDDHQFVALVDSVFGTPSAWNPNLTDGTLVYAVGLSGSVALVGGDFGMVDGNATHAYFAQFRFPQIEFTTTTSSGTEGNSVSVEVSQDVVSDFDSVFDVSLAGGTVTHPGHHVTGDYSFSDPSPYTIPEGDQTFDININLVDDGAAEGDETLVLTLVPYDPVFFGTNTTHTLTVHDSVFAGEVIISPTSVNVTEGGGYSFYDISLSEDPGFGNSVVVSITPNAQVTVSEPNVTFTSGNFASPHSILVYAEDDAIVEGAHTGTITHTVSGDSDDYNGLTPDSVTVNITDNDSAPTSSGGGRGGAPTGIVEPITNTPLGINPDQDSSVIGPPSAPSSDSNNQNNNSNSSIKPPLLTLNLQRGQRNNEVLSLQKFLNEHSFVLAPRGAGSPNNETTFFGPRTYRALIKFQKVYIDTLHKVTGKVDQATRNLINSIF